MSHLYGEVTTGHHNAITGLQNILQLPQRFSTFYFGNEPWTVALLRLGGSFAQRTGLLHVLGIFYKTHGDVVGTELYGGFNIATVFVG